MKNIPILNVRGSSILSSMMALLLSSGMTLNAWAALDTPPPIQIDPSLPDCGIQKAIDNAAANGGGVVQLPEGTFLLRRGLVMKSNVKLQGAGMDKTILMPARKVKRLKIQGGTSSPQEIQFVVDSIPEELQIGSGVGLSTNDKDEWDGLRRPGMVKELDRATKTITLELPYDSIKKSDNSSITCGVELVLAAPVEKGDTQIKFRNASLLRPGDEISFGMPPNESFQAHGFVKEIKENTVTLEEPIGVDMGAWIPKEKIGSVRMASLVWALFPLIHGANTKGIALRDLTVKGHGIGEACPLMTRYTLAGIHLFNTEGMTMERVSVRDWPSDGISLQTGKDNHVLNCEVTDCLQNGFHPGTAFVNFTMEKCLSTNNGVGFYFCWSNSQQNIRENKFTKNRKGGMTGLGNPKDNNITIEKNLIAQNGEAGIEINGGLMSGNIIRENIIENNSQAKPGKFPGIGVWASVEDAMDYTITGNTIRDTQSSPTQQVGVEEKDDFYKPGPAPGKSTFANKNKISGNKFSGHVIADIVTTGAETICSGNGEAKVVKGPLIMDEKAK